MHKKLNLIILIITSLFFCHQFASAASIGVKPDKIELTGAAGKMLTQEILIFNAGEAPGTYVLSADDAADKITIEPKEFVLEAGAERLVKIAVKKYFPKTISANISVISRPLDASGLSAAAGVKIPFQASYYFFRTQIILLSFCLALIIMILLKLIQNKKKL